MITTYKDSYPQLFIQICKEGGSICDFCIKADIVRSTFYEWVGAHEEFKEAFNKGKEYTEAWLTADGIQGMRGQLDGFNATAWSMLMRNKCGMTADRKIAIDFTECKNAIEKQAILDKRISEGRLTPTEIKHFSDYVAACMKAEENKDLRARLEKLEDEVNS
jgi:hypothetical protein